MINYYYNTRYAAKIGIATVQLVKPYSHRSSLYTSDMLRRNALASNFTGIRTTAFLNHLLSQILSRV